jgi:hypothetical protein
MYPFRHWGIRSSGKNSLARNFAISQVIEQLESRTLLSVTPVPFQHFTIDNNPGGVPLEKALMDVDGDKNLDAIVGFNTSGGNGGIVWYQFPHSGNPADKWNRYTIAVPGGGAYEDMLPYDLNGDGAMDLIASYNNNIVWFENPAGHGGDPRSGAWVQHTIGAGLAHELTLADLDGDGKIAVVSYTHIYFQNGPTSWTTINSPQAANPEKGVASYDSGSGLGKVDLVGMSPTSPNDISWFENPRDHGGNARTDTWIAHRIGPNYFPADTAQGVSFATTDVNGDGHMDVISAFGEGSMTNSDGHPGGLIWWQSPKDPTSDNWIKHTIDANVQNAHKLSLADMNNDGHLDIVFTEQEQSDQDRVGIYYNVDGTGNNWQLQVLSFISGHNQVAADINNDGAIDILNVPHGVYTGYNPVEVYMSQLKGVSSNVPTGWSDSDIAGPSMPGSASSSDGINWVVTGGGADIGGASDQFNFVSTAITANATMIAQINSITWTDSSAKSGLMFRATDDPNSPFADVVLTPTNGAIFQWRSSVGAAVQSTSVANLKTSTWFKLTRSGIGNTFTAFYSTNSTSWVQIGLPQTILMPAAILGGLASTARNDGMLNTAVFNSFALSQDAPPKAGDTVYFSDQPYTVTSNGWGPPEKDRSNGETGASDGRTITLNGQTYSKGLGVHANSDVRLDLTGTSYTKFLADIGVDDEVGNNGSVDFQVFLDNTKVFDSGTMTGTSPTQSISIPINGQSTLRLVVTDSGNGNASDHADWANARLIVGQQVPPPATPSNLNASFNSTTKQIDLSWADAANDETGFSIERKAGANGTYSHLVDLPAGTFTYSDGNNLAFGTTYYYHVYATQTGAPNSAFSNESNATVPTPPSPTTPSNLNSTFNSNTNKIDLTWNDPANDETGFRIERKAGVNGTYALLTDQPAGTFTYSDGNNLLPGTTYYYHVYAYQTGAPNSDFSNEANASVPIPPGTTSYFSDLPYTVTSNGWGPPEKDHSNGETGASDGHTITLNGQTYAKGLGVHANSDVRLNLTGGSYSQFLADIGVDDEVGNNGSVDFQIFLDNTKVFDSGTMTGASATQQVSVPINGQSTLRLVVTDSGNGNNSDHADWANARLISGPVVPPPATPSNLNASYNTTTGNIDLSWSDPTNDETGFRIERKAGINGTYAQIADLPAGTFTYPDGNNLVPGTTYYYHVYAYQTGAPNSGFSNEVNVTVPIPPGTTTYLSDLPFTVTANGWGPPEKDHSNGETGASDGHTITLNGKTYAKGLGVHANSDLSFALNGQYKQFISDIGVDDEVANNGSVDFQIYVDGQLKYDSNTMTGATATKTTPTIDLTNAQTLRLVVTDAGNGNNSDHADWASARVIS